MWKKKVLSTYIFGFGVEPMGNIGASSEDDRVASGVSCIFVEKEGQIKHLVEEGNPAVAFGVVGSDFFRSIEATQFVWSWDVLGLLDLGWP